jgi:PhnB protein
MSETEVRKPRDIPRFFSPTRARQPFDSGLAVMKGFQTYLNFDGATREAMTFYKECLGGDLFLQTFGETGAGEGDVGNRTMHARLTVGSAILMASDTLPSMTFIRGNNFAVNIACDTIEEIERYFAAFSKAGKVTMPLADQFWGARFGMIEDQFGVNWMFNCELPKTS